MASDTREPSRYLEEQKLAFDLVKHLTTLATGTTVLLATFLKDIFVDPQWRALVPLVFASLIVATVALSLAGFGLLSSVRQGPVTSASVRRFTALTTLVGMSTFLLGLCTLSVFAIRNWL